MSFVMDEWTALDRFFWEWNEYRKMIHGFMITVINIKALAVLPDVWVYVSGENRKLNLLASPLASPWTLDKESDRPILMKKYKQHLWGDLKRYDSEARLELFRLVRLAKNGDLYLGCHGPACRYEVVPNAPNASSLIIECALPIVVALSSEVALLCYIQGRF